MSALLDRKYRALDDFVARVRESEIGDNIAKLILHGSVLRGDAHEESDIDVLVIATGDLRQVDETCGDIAFDVMLGHNELVSPMVYCVDTLRHPISYFSYRAIKEGKEIYSMEEETIRHEETIDLLNLARIYLEMACSLEASLANVRGVIDLAYNAAELCGKGLLILRSSDVPRTHSGLVQQFSKVFVVEEKLVTPKIGRALRLGLELRNRARYDPHARLTESEATEITKLAEEMIGVLEKELYQ